MDSGNSSPRCRDPEPDDSVPKVKLMCSYGGRIQPRNHCQHHLSYVGGETKILAVDRSIRFPAFAARVTSLIPHLTDDLSIKYQLPGEDLDALVSLTNDEDLEHMILEHDRLPRPGRLRLFLFPVSVSPKSDSQWFIDALNAAPPELPLAVSPGSSANNASPDFLTGLDNGPQPPLAVKDDIPEIVTVLEQISSVKEERNLGGEAVAEIQRQIQDLQRLQIVAENQQAMAAAAGAQRNEVDETLAPKHASPQIPAAYWPEQLVAPVGSRYGSILPGDQPLYMIPSPYTGYYAVPRMMPAEAYRNAAAMYAMAPPAAGEGAAEAAHGYGVAYDNSGRAVFYTGSAVGPGYQAVTSVGPVNGGVEASKVVKPAQVS